MRLILLAAILLSFGAQAQFGPGGKPFGEGEGGQEGEGVKEGKPAKKAVRCGRDPKKEDCNTVLEFDQSTKKVYHLKTGKPFTGTCQSCHENGNIEHEVSFRDGKEDGQSQSYYPDGKQHTLRNFNYGLENGDWKYWFSEKDGGKLAWHFQYVDGKKNGKWLWQYKDGTVKKIENYNMGLLDGLVTKYWEPGKKKSEINFKQGDYHGSYVTYYRKNSQVSVEVTYNKGKEDGPVKHYYESGQISLEGLWKNGKKDGKWTSYFKDGADKTIETYANGVKEGKFYDYYEEGGKLKRDATYKQGYLYDEILFDQFGNTVDENGKKIDEAEVNSRNEIQRATAESRIKGSKKKKKGEGYDFASVDKEFMCGCIKAESAGEEVTDECNKAKNEFRKAMEKADKKTQKKMRQLINDCLK